MMYEVRLTPAQISALHRWYVEGESFADVLLNTADDDDPDTLHVEQGDTRVQILNDGTILPELG